MTTIRLTFIIDLRDFKLENYYEHYGPAFHRFLPNNKPDKVEKNLKSFDGLISFWFEKRGEVKQSYIEYDNKKILNDEASIAKQAILDAGPLYGEIIVRKITKKLAQVLKDNTTGDPDYLSFGKKIVDEIIDHSNSFINIFRDLYRQYWIKNVENWDSRNQSLGSFCKSTLALKYSLDNGKSWRHFLPDVERKVNRINISISHDYSDFIMQKDWIEIKKQFKNDFKPSIASSFLSQACATLDKGDLKKAFIEAVTTIEIAIECIIRKNPKTTNSILESIQSFKSLQLKTQFSIIALLCDNVGPKDIENSIKAINIRNSIVHEGYNPIQSDSVYIGSLILSISKIINEPVAKFPSANRGNAILSIESWEKENKN